MPSASPRSVVVVGAGLAGLSTVRALREQGYAGTLTLVGDEAHLPYDRPPLSKAVLLGEVDTTELDADWAELDVQVLSGVPATGVRSGAVATEAGDLAADAIVVATGAQPRLLPGAGQSVLRTVDDALALRARLRPGVRVVIIGAGWIGAEVATAASRAGCRTTVVEALTVPLAAALPVEAGARTTSWYAEAGVDLHLDARVAVVAPDGVTLEGGLVLAADVIVTGIGVHPATDWLAGSAIPRHTNGALLTDSGMRTAVPGVFAVGDCAAWASRRYGTTLTLEHWDTALHGPEVVAANVLGGNAAYDPVPYFWSEQWGRMLQYAGHWPAGEKVVRREAADGWALFWLAQGRLVAALTCDRPRDLVQARRLMERDLAVDAELLSDAAVAVKAAVA